VFGILTGCISDVTSRFETHSVTRRFINVTAVSSVLCAATLHSNTVRKRLFTCRPLADRPNVGKCSTSHPDYWSITPPQRQRNHRAYIYQYQARHPITLSILLLLFLHH